MENKINILVTRDGAIDDSYYDAIYAAKRRAALEAAGKQAVQVVTRPLVNFSLNMLDLLRDKTIQVK